VESCPTDALVFGDLDDPKSPVSERIQATGAKPPKDRFGIGPKVFYTHADNFVNALDRAFNPPRKI
jgi:Fe-S-cluster-containing dehydrogenase component